MKHLSLLIALSLAVISAQAQFTAGRVVVLRTGSANSTGNSGFLEEYNPSVLNGVPTFTVTLPNSGTTDDGTSIVFGNNSAFNHGISLSSDNAFVVIGAYANMLGSGAVDTLAVASGGANRVIGTVKYDGTYARPISSSTIFSGATFRDATSDGFGNYWGINGASLQYFGNGTPGLVQTAAGRCIGLANGNLYYTIAASVRGYSGSPTTADSRVVAIANHATSARLSHAPIEVASARPTCASGAMRTTLNTTFTPAAVNAALTGVAVSPRARKVAVTLRISTKGNRPNA